jgi:hypothetical protein
MKAGFKYGLGVVIGLLFSFAAMADEPIADGVLVACPSTDFHKFLDTFAESETIQRAFTNVPLKVQHIENDADLTQVVRWEQQIKFPQFPSRQEREKHSLELHILELSDSQAKVKIQKPDTDWLTHFFFSKDSCWRLMFVDDQSL